jgi:hypothetical protein
MDWEDVGVEILGQDSANFGTFPNTFLKFVMLTFINISATVFCSKLLANSVQIRKPMLI